jgi:hypothetical protein
MLAEADLGVSTCLPLSSSLSTNQRDSHWISLENLEGVGCEDGRELPSCQSRMSRYAVTPVISVTPQVQFPNRV